MNQQKTMSAEHSRHDFLRTTFQGMAAGLAFPTIVPASALGLGGRVAPSNRVTVAVILGDDEASIASDARLCQYLPGLCQQPRRRRDPHSWELHVRFVIRPPASTALDKPRGLWDLVDVVTENNLIRAIVTWMSPMPFPFAETVALTDLQRAQLESLVRAGSTPQALVFRCRLILRAADRDHPTNLQIAAEFDCNRHPATDWLASRTR